MKRAVFLTIALCLAPAFARAEFPEKLTIGTQTIDCRTADEIRKLGIECEDIPWKDNAARVLIDAMNACRRPSRELDDVLYKGAKKLDFGDDEEEAHAHFDENAEAFKLLRQSDAMPRFQLPMARSKYLSAVRIPHLAPTQQLGRELRYLAAFEFAKGKHAEAIDDCMLSMRLGRRVSTGPFLIDGLVGIAVQGLAMNTLHAMVASGKLTDAELKSLGERIAKDNLLPSRATAFKGERAFGLGVISDLQRYGGDVLGEQDVLKRMQWRLSFNAETTRKNLTAFYDFCDEQAKKPVNEALQPANNIDAYLNTHRAGWDMTTRLLAPGMGRVVIVYAREQVALDALSLRIALERFKLAHKAYPKELAEAVPAYLDKLPDPFSGKPYGYRLEADGHFVLWSVGEDMKDDGGKGDAKNQWAGPDFVFTSRPEKPAEAPKDAP